MLTTHHRLTLLLALLFGVAGAALGQSQAVVLQYHHISTATPPITSLSPADFRTHMEYLRDHGFTVLPLETVLAALRKGDELPDKAVALTFDDGYRSVYDEAFPLLKAWNWPFTVFVTAGLVNSNAALYANWDQLREMAQYGATMANHTLSHAYLVDRSPYANDADWLSAVEREISGAETRIEMETGQSHHILAYPYGEFDPAIQALVEKLGYIAFAQNSGAINATSDFTALPRFPFSGIYASMRTFPDKASSLAFNVKRLGDSPLTSEQAPEALLDFDGSYRFDALSCFHNDQPMQLILEDAQEQRYRLLSPSRSTSRRFHYNCTAPGRDGRFYWYSVLWINPAIAE